MKAISRIARDWPGKFFLAGLLLAVAAVIYMLIDVIFGVDLYRLTPLHGMKCGFRRMVGLYCPGCGATRALLALVKGKLITSVYYHPVPVYCFLLYANFMVRYIFSTMVSERCPVKLKPAKFRVVYVILLVVLLLGNWILRNVLLFLGWPI